MHLPAGKPPPLWLARQAAAALLLAAILSACLSWNTPAPVVQSPHSAPAATTASAVLSPVASLIHLTTPQRAAEQNKAIQLLFYLPVEGPFAIGDRVTVTVEAVPVVLSRLIGSAGEDLGTSLIPWEDHSITEMGIRLTWDQDSIPGLDWLEYHELTEYTYDVVWLGEKHLRLTAGFRDRSLETIPIYLGGKDLVEVAQVELDIEGEWDTSTPVEALPAPIQTIVIETQLAYPLAGSVLWEDGRCCAGGTAGETIQIRADFSASSPHGEVVEMRMRTGSTCFAAGELEQAAWEPFVLQRSFPFTLAINWVGFYITVQYRDLHGNLSPPICDDISLEGMPQRTP